MKLRPPAVPLITVDPYFSVWSPANRLHDTETVHWTCKPNHMLGTAVIDGAEYLFMGNIHNGMPKMEQLDLNVTALTTTYTFAAAGVQLTARFSAPLFLDDYEHLTRPVNYLQVTCASTDGKEHAVSVKIKASEELCLNFRGVGEVETEELTLGDIAAVKMGNKKQSPLHKSGDDIRIDWGYFYLCVQGGSTGVETLPVPFCEGLQHGDSLYMTFVTAEKALDENGALFAFAYDDIESIEYFHEPLKSWWNKDGQTITEAIALAYAEYSELSARMDAFSAKLFADAEAAGGTHYAEVLSLAYRQVCAGHKLVLDKNGDILYISKECHSNGCAATADVAYPSIPLFLLYNPELVNGMLRPLIRYSRSEEWANVLKFNFAPHDVGQYPILNGQVYGSNRFEYQMPVEECGNLIIMAAAAAVASGDVSYASTCMDLLETWAQYLLEFGADPADQLCTDDFAGHLAHNTNLSLKAISGIVALGILYKMQGKAEKYTECIEKARALSADWAVRAANGDGSYRLAFDRPGTFSMKYNIVWDKLFGTQVMNPEVLTSEVASYKEKIHPYGLPLDNRKPYTKSDWLVWTATLAEDRAMFEEMVEPLWRVYNYSESRVPMTDWYWTVTGNEVHFRHRTVQGGLFIKLLESTGKMKIN